MAFVLIRLAGRALDWATAVWNQGHPDCTNIQSFLGALQRVFDSGPSERDACLRLFEVEQGTRSVKDYAVDFRILAARSRWEDRSLTSAFYQGLADRIKDELVNRDWGTSMEDLITLASDVDERVRQRRGERRRSPARSAPRGLNYSASAPNPRQEADEPMNLGGAHLSPEERQRRLRGGLCLYCGQRDHLRSACPWLQGKASRH